MDPPAAECQMLLNEIQAIKDKSKSDANFDSSSRLNQIMETLLKSPPELRHQISQTLENA